MNMELLKINDKKLKVTLSENDMRDYRLDAEKIDYDCAETRRAFRDILTVAKSRTGFDTDECKIFVQIYPARDGGCEMFVTKLSDETDEGIHAFTAVYLFDDLTSLCCACSLLTRCGFRDRSALYGSDRGYYLIISEDFRQNNNTYSVNERRNCVPNYPILDEYGKRLAADKIIPVLKERFKEICPEMAVERMANLN